MKRTVEDWNASPLGKVAKGKLRYFKEQASKGRSEKYDSEATHWIKLAERLVEGAKEAWLHDDNELAISNAVNAAEIMGVWRGHALDPYLTAQWRGMDARDKPKPPRRSPLRREIVEAMRPLRAEGLTLHETLRSLTHSPEGPLRMEKRGEKWRCYDADEDWQPEDLSRTQLAELFKHARN